MPELTLLPSVIQALHDDALAIALDVRSLILDHSENKGGQPDLSNHHATSLVMRAMHTTQYLVKLRDALARGGIAAAQAAALRQDWSGVVAQRNRHPEAPAYLQDLIARQERVERRYEWLHETLCREYVVWSNRQSHP